MKKTVIALLLSIVCCQLSTAQIGTWRNYLAYHDVQQIQAAGDDLFVQASNALYQYNQKDQSIVTYDKVNGLSDTNISHIRWCQKAKRLVVVYQNSNIDLVETNGNVTNISSLYTKPIIGDKTVSSVRIDDVYAYLICGFGIVKVNVQRAEIADTYTSSHPEYPTTLPDEDKSDYDKYIDLVKTLKPGGPKHNKFGFMSFANHGLYTCANGFYLPGTVQVFKNNAWQIYQDEGINTQTGVSFEGALCLDVRQEASGDHLFMGGRNGLYEYQDGIFVKYYDYQNSPIERFDGQTAEYQLITGLKLTQQNELWILNSQAPTASLMRLKDGQFTKFNHSDLMKLNDGAFINKSNGKLSNMMTDSQGYLWFVNNHGRFPAFYRYDMASDELLTFTNFVNQDGTAINIPGDGGVRCVAEDVDGNIWAGTSSGPLLLEKSQIESPDPIYTQVKVPRNDGTNYADYLLAGIDITAIVVDGGGRKWFSTNNNGVYLISADNMTQLQHFTTDNSPLLSNTVQAMAINQETGEVFFGTENGLCSYISDATKTNEEMTKDNVWAYPNPVNPGYTGPITITGLSYNADVKILAANGAIVNEGKSNGGTYVWDGCDKKGRRVASGVYMVATATKNGEKGTVCKIAIVN